MRLCGCGDSTPAIATIDVEQMQQALTNLLVNAIQAMPNGGKAETSISREERKSSDEGADRLAAEHAVSDRYQINRAVTYWRLAIRDTGTGIAAENIPHLFEPFFTTKDIGEGTGLGLSIAYGIVRENGGWIEVDSRPGAGSCFTICLPEETTS